MDKEQENALLKKLSSLEDVKSNFYSFLENTSDFIYFKDINHSFTFTSNAFAALTNHNNWKDLIGKNDFDIFPEEHAQSYVDKEQPVLSEGKELLAIEEPYYDREGNLCWVSSSKRPIFNDKNEIVGLFGISRDITKIKQLETELSQKANYDDLTGLYNRAFFLDQSCHLLDLAKRNQLDVALFFIDLDGFKLINDTFGHKAGDFVLETVAKRLTELLRKTDIIGRLGGDEFTVISSFDKDAASLDRIAKKIINSVNQPIQFQSKKLEVGCSVGISSFPDHADNIDELVYKADKAMYQAKNSGKNRSVYFQK